MPSSPNPIFSSFSFSPVTFQTVEFIPFDMKPGIYLWRDGIHCTVQIISMWEFQKTVFRSKPSVQWSTCRTKCHCLGSLALELIQKRCYPIIGHVGKLFKACLWPTRFSTLMLPGIRSYCPLLLPGNGAHGRGGSSSGRTWPALGWVCAFIFLLFGRGPYLIFRPI